MGKIEAVLFDVDGVLVDSKLANFEWLSRVMSEYGYPEPKLEDYLPVFGASRRGTIKHLTNVDSEDELEKMMDFAKSKEGEYPTGMARLYKDETETLAKLSRVYKLGIVTNGSRISVRRFFEKADVEEYFNTVVTSEDVTRIKPDPEPLLAAASKLGVNPKNAVYVGDLDVDVMAGHAAGMKVIIFSKQSVEGADASVTEFKEIPKELTKLEAALF